MLNWAKISLETGQSLFAAVGHLTRSQKRCIVLLVDTCLAPLTMYLTSVFVLDAVPSLSEVTAFWILLTTSGLLAMAASISLGMRTIKLNSDEAHGIGRTGAMALLVTFGLVVAVPRIGADVPLSGVIFFGLLYFVLSIGARLAMLHCLHWLLYQQPPRSRVVIYGAGKTGMQLAAALRANHSIRPVAFVDENPALHSLTMAGLRIYPPDSIERLVHEMGVDRVLLAMPSTSAPKVAQILRRLQAKGIEVMPVPSFAQLAGVEKLVDAPSQVIPGQFLGRPQVTGTPPQGTEMYEGCTILVTGAGGSVGAELCRQLLASRPKCIVLYELNEFALYTIDLELRDLMDGSGVRIVPILGSVTDSRMVRATLADYGVEIVFHAAAYKHVPLVEANPIAGISNNVLGTVVVGEAANDAGVRKFVLISTDKAVRPTNVMGACKRLAELVVQDLAARSQTSRFSIVRFGNVLGSSGSVIPLFHGQIARGGPITLTHEDVTRFFMSIGEAARLVLLAGSFASAETQPSGEVFALDMGPPVKIRDLARQMIAAAGFTVRDTLHQDGDIEIVTTGLRPGEKLHEELLIGNELLVTPHPKILRAREQGLSSFEITMALQELRLAIANGDAATARAILDTYVEGYGCPERLIAAQ